MVDLNPKIPVIMLSIKVSETLIKSQGLLDGIKKKTTEPYAAYKQHTFNKENETKNAIVGRFAFQIQV